MKIETIAVLSDVSVGYGSPQIISLTRSLAQHFQAKAVIFEPDQSDRPSVAYKYPDLQIERIFTASHPYSGSGQIDFTLQLADALRKMRPDLVVVCAFHGAAALVQSGVGRKIIYYGYEHTDGVLTREIRVMGQLAKRIDYVAFCEENRALLDAKRLGLSNKPTAILYNCSDLLPSSRRPQKNDKIVYAGQIDPDRTFGRRFFSNDFDAFPFDLYGSFRNFPDAQEQIEACGRRGSLVNYCGLVEHDQYFLKLISSYLYSFIAWAPDSESTYYAAPNKFFDAITAGTPPLTAPHPLCVRLIKRYGCGRVLPGWGEDDMKRGIDDALAFAQTDAYDQLVGERLPIAAKELTWEAQFQKLVNLMNDVPGGGA
ncbi:MULTISPECIES: hypothetical protein [Asticcacaulis]|uniref:hypothetical protein n=1 Tax=Asticcacaulis TaxID=76890 RepID=UPI001AE7CA26|nr:MULTISPECIES: hypothetical protein [Asticcacaulis]MBP2161882.1 glycosyltransferase involved in cell wall biosynthesis [Asticcacaulis solisilvae]MDR6802929.1 glycosyltransferase involved in cell wall biosynthesis [Asticcacaulis sp. BE141]